MKTPTSRDFGSDGVIEDDSINYSRLMFAPCIDDPGLRRFREGRRSIERGEAAEAALPRFAGYAPVCLPVRTHYLSSGSRSAPDPGVLWSPAEFSARSRERSRVGRRARAGRRAARG